MSILTFTAPAVNFEFPAGPAGSADDYRPTAGPDFVPTLEEDAEASELLNGDEPDDAYWDARAGAALSLEAICSGPWL